MYRKIFSALVFISLSASNLVFSQQKVLPGAVEDPSFWIKTRNNADAYYWESLTKKEGKISQKKQSGAAFNAITSSIKDYMRHAVCFWF